jgi:hypothetical protein
VQKILGGLMEFSYYWKHRASIKAKEIDDLLQEAIGKAYMIHL